MNIKIVIFVLLACIQMMHCVPIAAEVELNILNKISKHIRSNSMRKHGEKETKIGIF